jgi:hypothetical protein
MPSMMQLSLVKVFLTFSPISSKDSFCWFFKVSGIIQLVSVGKPSLILSVNKC